MYVCTCFAENAISPKWTSTWQRRGFTKQSQQSFSLQRVHSRRTLDGSERRYLIADTFPGDPSPRSCRVAWLMMSVPKIGAPRTLQSAEVFVVRGVHPAFFVSQTFLVGLFSAQEK
jgi:hypothetical protein